MRTKRKHYKVKRTVLGDSLMFHGEIVKTYQLNLSKYLFNGLPIMIDEYNSLELKGNEVAFIKLQ